jgi:hypothetical protein
MEVTLEPIPAIDMWAPIFPLPALARHIAENFPEQMYGYLRVFYKQPPSREGLAQMLAATSMSEEDVVAALDAAGVTRALITGFDEKKSVGKTFVPNELITPLAARYPERFLPFAGIDILEGMEGVRALERWIKERGFRGLSLRPFMIGLPADHRRYYPFYAKCAELGVPVSIHTSANWTTVAVSDLGHPRHLDVVAADFPELKLILSHAGYPWVLEAVLLAWKYPNVYLELAAHRPRYLPLSGTGWEPLMRFGQSTVAEKILFGSGCFLLGRPLAQIADEFRELPLPRPILEGWLYRNATALFEAPAAGK